MVEHTSYTCDLCGEVFLKEITPSFKIVALSDIERFHKEEHGNVAVILFKYTRLGYDLCSKCNKELQNWIEHKRQKLEVDN